jgi:hypothetical protein
VQLAKDSPVALPDTAKAPSKAPYTSDTGELTFDKDSKLLVLRAPSAAGVFGTVGKSRVTAGPVDVELGPAARGFATILLTALDALPIPMSNRLLLSLPGYSLRALPAPGNRPPAADTAQPQLLKFYPGTTDWWTLDAANSANQTKPSGDMNGGWQPVFMESVEAYITLRTSASGVTVSALDGAGNVAGVLAASEVQPLPGGFRIHVNGAGAVQSPWFAIAAAQSAAPLISASPNPIVAQDGTGLGQTTVTWSAPGHERVEVHVASPRGPLMAAGGSAGSQQTEAWVSNGMQFFLTDAATGEVLASVTVSVRPAQK